MPEVIAARGAEAALHADEPSKHERAEDQQPEDGGVEERVDREAGPDWTVWNIAVSDLPERVPSNQSTSRGVSALDKCSHQRMKGPASAPLHDIERTRVIFVFV